MTKKKSQRGPVTRGEVQTIVDGAVDELAQTTDKNFRRVDGDIAEVKKTVKDTRETVKTILKVVQGIDRDNKESKNHNLPERVTQNEHDIIKLKARLG